MTIELIDRGIMDTRRQGYTLNSNSLAGFKNAVNNGQTRLALEYAEILIDQLISRVSLLENSLGQGIEVEDSVAETETKEKPTRTKKAVQQKEIPEEV